VFPVGARRLLIALLALSLVSGAVAPALLTAGTEHARPGIAAGAAPGGEGPAPAATTPADNDSIRHEDPDEAGEDGDLESVQGWLLGRISDRLEGSTVNISQGQYDAAEGALDDQTREYLDQYIDVAGDTESEADDETAETINETVEEQREFAQTRRNYSELYSEYREALENDNTERARRLGRQLADLERRLNRTGRNLSRNYREVGNRTGVDTGEERRLVNGTVDNVSEIQTEIREDLFTETRVEIVSSTPNASALDPLVVRGRVVTENGTPVSEGVIRLEGGLNATANLNATGYFTLQHHPILLPRGATNLTLGYRPPGSSPFLGSTGNVTVAIRGHEPTLEVTGVPRTAEFGENLSVLATLTVESRTIEGVPIEATLGGEPLASTTTANGSTTLRGVVPAAVDDGPQELRVSLPVSGRAIATTNATRSLAVEETTTWLTTGVTTLSPTRMRVRGTLDTFVGEPIPDQTVRVRIGGEMAGNATTNETGAYAVTLTIPDAVNVSDFEDRRVPVTVTFAAPETSLASVTEERTVTIPAESAGDGGLFGLGIPWWAWIALAVLALGVAAGAALFLTRRDEQAPADPGGDGAETPPTDPESPGEGGQGDSAITPSLLAVATERLEAGATDSAAEAGYEAVRRRLGGRFGVATGTHWELYRASQAAGWPEDRVAAIRRLTEAYEQAAFAPGSLSSDAAREAIATARDLIDDDDDDVASGSD
jgi:hypothetical protein